MELLKGDPAAQAAVLYAVGAVERQRQQCPLADPPFTGPDPELVPFAIAEVAAILADEVDKLGGDAGAILERIWWAVGKGQTEGAGHE